jgi:hypothetical protein
VSYCVCSIRCSPIQGENRRFSLREPVKVREVNSEGSQVKTIQIWAKSGMEEIGRGCSKARADRGVDLDAWELMASVYCGNIVWNQQLVCMRKNKWWLRYKTLGLGFESSNVFLPNYVLRGSKGRDFFQGTSEEYFIT